MASATKKVDKIRQIVQLKQVIKRWKAMSLRCRSVLSYPDDSESDSNSGSSRRIPPGFLAVYVGLERKRFLIPTRYLNLPIFISLLQKAEEEFGYQAHGGLALPCDVGFFKELLKVLEKDEQSFRRLELDEFLKMFSEVGLDSCKEGNNSCNGFTPLLQKARV
ncbi:auxin-responsive protein SAUR50-like [Telopea speciosissima]|uniref:auxin-responsive protein SAUR50-like n=1 Tax=Telopea speciosissima TaxID=54955 RepID=UPI001CC34446|nr:auxin-responsive protein SAUR50-like [Telopea speciosissima]